MTEWNVETALNHHPGCSVYDDGACTCGLRARREQIERSPLAPGEGTWSVFAQRVVAERDAAREEAARLTDEIKRLRGAFFTIMGLCDSECSCAAGVIAKRALDGKDKP